VSCCTTSSRPRDASRLDVLLQQKFFIDSTACSRMYAAREKRRNRIRDMMRLYVCYFIAILWEKNYVPRIAGERYRTRNK